MSKAYMLNWFTNRLNHIDSDSDNIMELSKTTYSAEDFDNLLQKIQVYIHDSEITEETMKKVKIEDASLVQKSHILEEKLKKKNITNSTKKLQFIFADTSNIEQPFE